VWGSGLRVWSVGARVKGFEVWSLGFTVKGFELGVYSLGFRV